MDIEATKFYIRHREGYPETEMQDYARRGMWTLNVETVPYEWVTDILSMSDLGPTVGIAGYVDDIHHALQCMGKPVPDPVDYPEELKEFLGRNIVRGTLEDLRRRPGCSMFVKPVEHKIFTGFVWEGDSESRRRIVTHRDETPVWISEPLKMITEWRCFILRNKVLAAHRYKGVWDRVPDRKVVLAAAEAMRKNAPAAYCLDFAVTDDDKTVLVEMNDGYAFGHYGLHPVSYAQMLSARWYELAGNEGSEQPIRSPGTDLPCDLRLLRGSLREREEERIRQGIYEVWETKARRDWAKNDKDRRT
jgi:hypothetical protein